MHLKSKTSQKDYRGEANNHSSKLVAPFFEIKLMEGSLSIKTHVFEKMSFFPAVRRGRGTQVKHSTSKVGVPSFPFTHIVKLLFCCLSIGPTLVTMPSRQMH